MPTFDAEFDTVTIALMAPEAISAVMRNHVYLSNITVAVRLSILGIVLPTGAPI